MVGEVQRAVRGKDEIAHSAKRFIAVVTHYRHGRVRAGCEGKNAAAVVRHEKSAVGMERKAVRMGTEFEDTDDVAGTRDLEDPTVGKVRYMEKPRSPETRPLEERAQGGNVEHLCGPLVRLTEAQQLLEVTRIAYTKDDMPVETVINVFPSQQWRLSYEWTAE